MRLRAMVFFFGMAFVASVDASYISFTTTVSGGSGGVWVMHTFRTEPSESSWTFSDGFVGAPFEAIFPVLSLPAGSSIDSAYVILEWASPTFAAGWQSVEPIQRDCVDEGGESYPCPF